jgi:hypothetical protein
MGSGPALDLVKWIQEMCVPHAESAQQFSSNAIRALPISCLMIAVGT